MRVLRDELHLLTGAYVVDALTGEELAEFERHLYRCAACTEEVRGLRETTAALGMAAAVAPPPEMRPRVLAAATRMRQLPPSARTLPGHVAPRKATGLRRFAPRPSPRSRGHGGRHRRARYARGSNWSRREPGGAQILAAPDARIETYHRGRDDDRRDLPHDGKAVVTTVTRPCLRRQGLPAVGDALR